MNTIETNHLSKQYGEFQALQQVNLRVPAGSIYGFIGLNGAGKTTTMRILLKMIRSSSGEVLLMGKNIEHVSSDFWNHIGYLIETPQSYAHLTTFQNLDLYARMREIPRAIRFNRIDYYMNELGLTAYRNTAVRDLSLGNRQKIGIIKALIHEPQILLLDEPTNGLDPQGLNQVRLLLQQLAREKGTTVFISSHILAEMEHMLTDIGVLSHGHLIQQGRYTDFRSHASQHMIATFDQVEQARKAATILQAKKISYVVEQASLIISRPEQQDAAIKIMAAHHTLPASWHQQTDGLEQYFLKLLAKEEKEHGTA